MTFKHKLSKRLALNGISGRAVMNSRRSARIVLCSSALIAAGCIAATGIGGAIDAVLHALEITPASTWLELGSTTQFVATPRDSLGNVLPGRTVSWSSSATNVATVNSTGVVTAQGVGTTTITATSEDVQGTASLTVVEEPPVASDLPVHTVVVAPASSTLWLGRTAQFSATLRDSLGNLLTGRTVIWSSNATTVATVSTTGVVTAQGLGTATITASSEGKQGNATVTVVAEPPAGAGVPVYDASNSNHVLHVFEDWSTYATIAEIGVKTRVDGGGPWSNNQSPSYKTFSTTNNDPWFGTKTVTINLQDRPADNTAHNRGFVLTNTSTSPAPFLNASAARESIVIEWAVRQAGEALYVGKIADWNPQGSPQLYRFNLQNSYDRLGSRAYASCDPDPLCNAYYANNGSTPRFTWLPRLGAFGDQFARSFSEGGTPTVHHWTQNRNHGSGPGQFDYAASLDDQNRRISPFLDNVWRRYIIRLTLNQPGQPAGHGRVEQWIQRYPEPPVKVMDFIGDVGGADQGLIHTGPSGGHWINPSAHIHWYGLTAVGQIFKGGNTLHLGYFRMWSHPRQ